jgi:serine protease Do
MSSSRVTPLWFGAVLGLAFALAILLVWILNSRFGVDGTGFGGSEPAVEVAAAPATQRQTPDVTAELGRERENAIVRAIRRASPAVVSINTVRHTARPATPADLFLGSRQTTQAIVGLGSGILVDHRGYVLTSNHIVAGSEQLRITLSDGQSFDAELIGASASYDLAVIKIAGQVSGLPTAPLGDSDRVTPGEWAIALGSPFSYLVEDNQPTVTVGVISAVDRSVRPHEDGPLYRDMIQTDAAINPGNSGGPLVDVNGEVVGINTTVITDSGGARTGLGFAIPINRGRWVMEEILNYGRVRPFSSGLSGFFLDQLVRQRKGLGGEIPTGWLVETVDPDSPASDAGLQPGDVITHVDGQTLVDDRARARSLFEARVGSTLQLTVWRDGRTFDAELTLEEATP